MHLKDKDPETWAEIIRICEEYSGSNAAELARELRSVTDVSRQTVHNWIAAQDIPFAGQPRVEREVHRGGRDLSEREPETWAEVLRVCQECANKDKPWSHAFGRLRHLGFSRASLSGWIDAGKIPAYTRAENGNIRLNKKYF